MFVVTYRKLFFILSGALILISLAAMIFFGFNFGIDFKGGTITQVSYASGRPAQQDIKAAVTSLGFQNFSDATIQPTGTDGFNIETRVLTNDEKQRF